MAKSLEQKTLLQRHKNGQKTIGDIARRFNEKRGHWEMNFEII